MPVTARKRTELTASVFEDKLRIGEGVGRRPHWQTRRSIRGLVNNPG